MVPQDSMECPTRVIFDFDLWHQPSNESRMQLSELIQQSVESGQHRKIRVKEIRGVDGRWNLEKRSE